MPIQTPNDLFMHELSDMYDAEQRIAQILPQLAQESNDQQAKSAFQEHEQETQQHVKNLEECFQVLGSQPERSECLGIQGLVQEHDHFLQEQPSPDILTMFDLGAAAKTEHYEMASYKGLIEKANLLGQQDVARLLQQNLQQEEAMLHRVEMLGRQVAQEHIQAAATV